MVTVLAWSAVDRWFEPCSGHTNVYQIDIYCFSAKHGVFERKKKDWLARNRDNVFEWRDMSICRLLFSDMSICRLLFSDMSICRLLFSKLEQHKNLVQNRHHYHLIECNVFSP
jgi:hypothetical protein